MLSLNVQKAFGAEGDIRYPHGDAIYAISRLPVGRNKILTDVIAKPIRQHGPTFNLQLQTLWAHVDKRDIRPLAALDLRSDCRVEHVFVHFSELLEAWKIDRPVDLFDPLLQFMELSFGDGLDLQHLLRPLRWDSPNQATLLLHLLYQLADLRVIRLEQTQNLVQLPLLRVKLCILRPRLEGTVNVQKANLRIVAGELCALARVLQVYHRSRALCLLTQLETNFSTYFGRVNCKPPRKIHALSLSLSIFYSLSEKSNYKLQFSGLICRRFMHLMSQTPGTKKIWLGSGKMRRLAKQYTLLICLSEKIWWNLLRFITADRRKALPITHSFNLKDSE